MQLQPSEKTRAYWSGAISSALKGIPQGILLGLIGAGVLIGGIYVLGVIGGAGAGSMAAGLAYDFGSFLFSNSAASAMATAGATSATLPAFSLAALNPLPVIALNTVLTMVGNFLTGGDAAVAAYHQQKHNELYDTRIKELDGREQMIEQVVGKQSRAVQEILSRGPQGGRSSFAEAQEARAEAPQNRTIH